jgi:ubiquitin carboxyl-terminal hydrolase 7
VLLDNLETKMKGTPLQGRAPALFRGRFRSYVRCPEASFQTSHDEDFYDLSLTVRNCGSLRASLLNYIEKELLEGDN